jgi:glycosyltransferase involved in cell wall biosynthesis
MTPSVSIVMPVYNREKYVGRAIQSVLNQTFTNWELIVVDDCSTDGTCRVASSFTDSRISIITMPDNRGAAAARNVAIRKSRGLLISFLDSDDAYLPKFIERTVSKFNIVSQNIGIVWTGVRYIRGAGNNKHILESMWRPAKNHEPYFLFLSDLRIGTNSGITIRKQTFDRIGLFDETLPAAEDTDLFLRISQHYRYDFIDECLIEIHQTEADRLSKRFDKIAQAYELILPKHIKTISLHKSLRLKFFYKMLWLSYHSGRSQQARNYFRKLLKDGVVNAKGWFVFLLFEVLGKKIGASVHSYFSGIKK